MTQLAKINNINIAPNATPASLIAKALASGNEFTLKIFLGHGIVVEGFVVTHVINDALVGLKPNNENLTIIPFHAILQMEII